jgi:hypothetical protein
MKGLSLNFTRIQNHGVKQLCDSLSRYRYKAIRIHDPNLYSIDLTNNFIDQKGVFILATELFKVDPAQVDLPPPHSSQFIPVSHKVKDLDVPLNTSIRILILDFNFLTGESMDLISRMV